MSQRQAGYGAIWIKLPAGTFLSSQMRDLAEVLEANDLTGVRIAVNQDLVIPWVPFDRVRAVYDALSAQDLAEPGARTTTGDQVPLRQTVAFENTPRKICSGVIPATNTTPRSR